MFTFAIFHAQKEEIVSARTSVFLTKLEKTFARLRNFTCTPTEKHLRALEKTSESNGENFNLSCKLNNLSCKFNNLWSEI